MLRSERRRELDLAPPNAARTGAKGKPLLVVYRRQVGGMVHGALGWVGGTLVPLDEAPTGLLSGGIGTLRTYMGVIRSLSTY